MKHPKQLIINATKTKGQGDLPDFIHLGHRHLQKEHPEGTHGDGSGVREYIVPLDLLRMTISPALLLDIEEVKVAYKKGGC